MSASGRSVAGNRSGVTLGESTSLGERLTAISERLGTLREHAAALATRVEEAAERSREVRAAPAGSCNHGAQVQEMQHMLEAVEHELEGLRTAMLTRGVIEQAKGMLMMERHCDADEAFRVLVELSQTSHHKLFDVAQVLVREWAAGGHGSA